MKKKNKHHTVNYWLNEEHAGTPSILTAFLTELKKKLEKTAKLTNDRYKCYWCKKECNYVVRGDGVPYLACSKHLKPIQAYFLIRNKLNAIPTNK